MTVMGQLLLGKVAVEGLGGDMGLMQQRSSHIQSYTLLARLLLESDTGVRRGAASSARSRTHHLEEDARGASLPFCFLFGL